MQSLAVQQNVRNFALQSESSAVGSALRSGRRGRAFESPLSDRKERILYILSFFVQSFISEMPPLSDRKERILYILSFFVQNLISEMPPIYDRNVSK